MQKQIITLDTETTSLDPNVAKCLGVGVKEDGKASVYYNHMPTFDWTSVLVVAQNAKYDAAVIWRNFRLLLPIYWDTQVAEYVLNIDKPRKLEKIYERRFGGYKEDIIQVYNRVTNNERKTLPDEWWKEVDENEVAKYCKEDVDATYQIYLKQLHDFKTKPELYKWFTEVEMPLLNLLIQSEITGIRIDRDKLTKLKNRLTILKNEYEGRLKVLAGSSDFNLNSSKQLQELLFKKFRFAAPKKTKTGFSTDGQTMEILAEKYNHAFPKLMVKYKEVNKILSTYTDSLLEKLDFQDRIHTTFNQALTNTRRFSSENPNLQNMPVKSEYGSQVKQCFIPNEGNVFLIADYDQIELRLLAHFSQDEILIDAFRNGLDVHQRTADLIGKALGKEFPRSHGKLLNFSIIYGKTPYGFAQDWGCSQAEAEHIINIYFKQFKSVRKYIELQQARVKNSGGWTKSIAGLPLYVGCPIRSNGKYDEHVLRCAVNYPIQSSSQDILKKAIVDIARNPLIPQPMIPVLMVHDELVYEFSPSASNPEGIVAIMETAWKLDNVPIKVTWKITERWEK
jgi:DNA polymerase-1